MAKVSMELTPTEREKELREHGPDSWHPRYAGGLCLWFDTEALKRLNLKEPLKVGTIVEIAATARVTGQGMDEHETKDGSHVDKRMNVQITDMEFVGEAKSAADTLYPDQGKAKD